MSEIPEKGWMEQKRETGKRRFHKGVGGDKLDQEVGAFLKEGTGTPL